MERKYKIDIQYFGGRGATSSNGGLFSRTAKQDKTIKKLAKQTANLKKEQYRIIDSDGNVVLVKKGDRGSVKSTYGEKRQYLDGNISLHNHPAGGTFSPDDIDEFGFGAKEIVVSSPEGTYRLINANFDNKKKYDGWKPMMEKMEKEIDSDVSYFSLRDQAMKNLSGKKNSEYAKAGKQLDAITNKFVEIRKEKGQEKANAFAKANREKMDALQAKRSSELKNEVRRLEVKPYHDFYKENAKKFGFVYKFEKKKGKGN